MSAEEAIAVVRRNTEEVQGKGNFEVFEELFAADFVDHTPQPGVFSADRNGARALYKTCARHFPTFVPRSIGRSPMETASQRLRHITAPTVANL